MPGRAIDNEGVVEIRRLSRDGATQKELAEIFDVSPRTVSDIVRYSGAYSAQEPARSNALYDQLKGVDWPDDPDWREHLDLWERINQQHKRLDPHLERFSLDFSERDTVVIASASDLHMGGGFTDHRAVQDTIEYILDTDGLYVGITGDTIEGFLSDGRKPAETTEQMAGSIKAQLSALKSLVKELAGEGKLLWMTWGDHDAKWFEQATGVNSIKNSVHNIVPYFTGRGLVDVRVGDQRYWIQCNHSERFRSQWNKTHPSRRQYERFFPANVNITGHTHAPSFHMEYLNTELAREYPELGGKVWFVVNGTFKTGTDPYTIRGWSRGVLGVPSLVLRGDVHDVDILDSPEKAVALVQGEYDARR